MKFETKAGSLTTIVNDGLVQVKAFSATLWSIPCESVTNIVSKSIGFGNVKVTLYMGNEKKDIAGMPQRDYDTFLSHFPNVSANEAKGKAWYHDLTKSTHVATYTSQKEAAKEIEEASKFGWQVQTSAAQNGKFSVGKALVGGFVTSSPVGLLAGAIGNKGKLTFTFTRSK